MPRLFIFEPNSARRLATTYRSMARERHRDAVRILETDEKHGRDRFLAMLRDVDSFEEQARIAEAMADEAEVALARMVAERMRAS
jgi:hypothetical protein